jgi:hypothetical protein
MSYWDSTGDNYADVDLEFDFPVLGTGEYLYLYFRQKPITSGGANACTLKIEESSGNYKATLGYSVDGIHTDLESYTMTSPVPSASVPCRIVAHGRFVTVYLNRTPVWVFYDSSSPYDGAGSLSLGNLSSNDIANARVREFHEWRDTLIVDMGSDMGSALGNGLENRFARFYGDGFTLRYSRFTSRDDLGTWEDVVLTDSFGSNDADHISVERVVGVEIIEKINHEYAKEFGLIFDQMQNTTALGVERMSADADLAIQLSNQLLDVHQGTLRAMLDAQIEDKVKIKFKTPDLKVATNMDGIIHAIKYSMAQATLQMEVVVRKNV